MKSNELNLDLDGDPFDTYCVYFIKCTTSNMVKIGYTEHIAQRFEEIQKYSPEKLEILKLIYVQDEQEARDLESQTHQQLKIYRAYREWFNIPQYIQERIQNPRGDGKYILPNTRRFQ